MEKLTKDVLIFIHKKSKAENLYASKSITRKPDDLKTCSHQMKTKKQSKEPNFIETWKHLENTKGNPSQTSKSSFRASLFTIRLVCRLASRNASEPSAGKRCCDACRAPKPWRCVDGCGGIQKEMIEVLNGAPVFFFAFR